MPLTQEAYDQLLAKHLQLMQVLGACAKAFGEEVPAGYLIELPLYLMDEQKAAPLVGVQVDVDRKVLRIARVIEHV